MTRTEIRELPPTELDRKLHEQRDELVGLRLRKSSGQVENTARLRDLRRLIARLETIKREKARAAAAPVAAS